MNMLSGILQSKDNDDLIIFDSKSAKNNDKEVYLKCGFIFTLIKDEPHPYCVMCLEPKWLK